MQNFILNGNRNKFDFLICLKIVFLKFIIVLMALLTDKTMIKKIKKLTFNKFTRISNVC